MTRTTSLSSLTSRTAFECVFQDYSKEDRKRIKKKYATEEDIIGSPQLQPRHRVAICFFDGVNRDDIEECMKVLRPEDMRHA
ncbi:hypothetical protein HT574_18420 [Parageobacillus sp. VR-IP]|uniref:hypothetical protein n=1 Tax=Parageobacillus sp. VR-IP TaxID=2742205 RepID=UPI001583D0A7|nr:hypothetical protein [Parageobacillus sp. VR-IP]NUK31964.1 hypothetical protein [Parageobacillus sp. VR-IP]